MNVAWKPQLWVDSIAGRLAGRKASEDLARAGMAAGRGTRGPPLVGVPVPSLDQLVASASPLYFGPFARTVVEAAESSAEAAEKQARAADTLALG